MLTGKVKEIKPGAVNTEIVIQLDTGPQIVSIITGESGEKLGLAVGKEAYTISKASNVMIGID